jgi:hypothetical protein
MGIQLALKGKDKIFQKHSYCASKVQAFCRFKSVFLGYILDKSTVNPLLQLELMLVQQAYCNIVDIIFPKM